MNKLLVSQISFYFFIAALIALVGLGIYSISQGNFTGMTALRGVTGLIICIWGIISFRKTINKIKSTKQV